MSRTFRISEEEMKAFMGDSGMYDIEGIYACYETTPEAIAAILPPPLTAARPIVSVYAFNVGKPGFCAQYNEAAISVPVAYGDYRGNHMFSVMVSGPGAEMAMDTGRDVIGFPKKIADDITITRDDKHAHAYVERKGVRIFDVDLMIGEYNDPMGAQIYASMAPGEKKVGRTLLYSYDASIRDGKLKLDKLRLNFNESEGIYDSWEGGNVKITVDSGSCDPWGCLPVVKPLGGAWAKCTTIFTNSTPVAWPNAEEVFPYLFGGRYDISVLKDHPCQEFKFA